MASTINDHDLIALLNENARSSLEDIASSLNATVKAVAKRMDELEESGKILKYIPVLNPTIDESLNSTTRAFVELSVSPQKSSGYDSIAKRIYQYSQVVEHYLLSGQYDFLVIVEGDSYQEVASFVFEKLATIEHVKTTNTHFIFKQYKGSGVVFDKGDTLSRLPVFA